MYHVVNKAGETNGNCMHLEVVNMLVNHKKKISTLEKTTTLFGFYASYIGRFNERLSVAVILM